MTEKRLITQEQPAKTSDEWLKYLDEVNDRLEKAIDVNKYIFPNEYDKTRELAFIIFDIVSVGFYELRIIQYD